MIRALRMFLGTVLLMCSTVLSFAQTAAQPDYAAWKLVAARATEAVAAGRASDVALEDLRAQLDVWREEFRAAQDTNQNTIATVQNQIAALGPEPAEGAAEPADIAVQRSQLNDRLAELQIPVRTAEVAYTEAEGLIRGVDNIIRSRQADELLELGPTPLNPVSWTDGLVDLASSIRNIGNEFLSAWGNTVQRAEMQKNIPQVVLLLAIALLLLARGRRWIELLAAAVEARGATLGRWLATVAISVGQVALPFVGLLALIEAVYATELPGLRGDVILSSLPLAGFYVLAAYWLGLQMFPKSEAVKSYVRLPVERRQEGRLHFTSLGFVLAVEVLLTEIARYDTWSDQAIAVVFFPLFVIAALMLWRIAMLILQHTNSVEEGSYTDNLMSASARLLFVSSTGAVALAAIGYFEAADRLMIPTIITLLILAFVLILQRVTNVIFEVINGTSEDATGSLLTVLIGFALVVLALPILALVWGARVSDLTELWTQISKGLSIGETQISPRAFFIFVLVFVAGYMITRLLQGAMKNTILPKTKMDIGGQNAIVSGLGYVGIFLAGLVAINSAGIDLSSIALVAGALSVGIGFGLQNVVSNFVSGIILLIERPISEGDWIEVNGNMGIVRDISVRSTRVETFDRTDVIVPNADLVSGTVTNYTRGNTIGRVIVPIGVAYGTDPRRIEDILLEIANAHPMTLADPAPSVVFQGFGASSLDFEIRAIVRDVNWSLTVRSELNYAIAERFMAEGIEIPFAQTDIWLRNPETLRGPKDE